MIRAEIWVEFCDELNTVAEIESENIIVDTYEEIQDELNVLVEHYEESFESCLYSWGEVAEWQSKFEKLGKRYGLLREFRENGIC